MQNQDHHSQTMQFVKSVAANLNNLKLSDADFRGYIRDEISSVEGVDKIIAKFSSSDALLVGDEKLPQLRSHYEILPFNLQDESRYNELNSFDMLKEFYPFCQCASFAEDMILYKKLLQRHGLVMEAYKGEQEVLIQ